MRKIKDLGETILWGLLLLIVTVSGWVAKRKQVSQIGFVLVIMTIIVWVAIAGIVRDQKIGSDYHVQTSVATQSLDEFQKNIPEKSKEFFAEEKKRHELWLETQKGIREGKCPPPREEDGGVMSILKD